MLISFLCSKSLIWISGLSPPLLVFHVDFSLFHLILPAFLVVFFILWPSSINSLDILINSVLNSASGRLVISILFSSCAGFYSVLSFGPYFFFSSIWQPPCVCFCVLGRTALNPCVSSTAYCRKGTCKLCEEELNVIIRVRQPASLLFGSLLGGRLR